MQLLWENISKCIFGLLERGLPFEQVSALEQESSMKMSVPKISKLSINSFLAGVRPLMSKVIWGNPE